MHLWSADIFMAYICQLDGVDDMISNTWLKFEPTNLEHVTEISSLHNLPFELFLLQMSDVLSKWIANSIVKPLFQISITTSNSWSRHQRSSANHNLDLTSALSLKVKPNLRLVTSLIQLKLNQYHRSLGGKFTFQIIESFRILHLTGSEIWAVQVLSFKVEWLS